MNPLLALRWHTLALRIDGETSTRARLAPGQIAEGVLTASPVLRIQGTFAPGCEPRVSRRHLAGDGWLDVPVPVAPPVRRIW